MSQRIAFHMRLIMGAALLSYGSLSAAASQIDWQQWNQAAFDQAKRENKIIIVDVGTEWCGACQMMDWFTYTDAKVIELINRYFVAIQVDAELQPDIGEQYSAWGWPATIFMTPDGVQVNELAGNRLPERFVSILGKVIEKHDDGTLPEWKTRLPENTKATAGAIDDLLARVTRQLDSAYDTENGGWGFTDKNPFSAHIEQAFYRGHVDNDPKWRARALFTLEQTALLLDPVWGGLYTAGINNDWRDAMPEKLTKEQAGTIYNFAEAYHVTGENRWLSYAQRIKDYMDAFLRAPDGTYYNSQDMYHKPGSARLYDRSYYQLDDAGRRAIGMPAVDRTIYTDINARVILAFVRMYAASGDDSFLEDAVQIANVMVDTRRHPQGWFRHVRSAADGLSAGRIRDAADYAEETIYLRSQVWMGRALLALYGTTAQQQWLRFAEDLVDIMQTHLRDQKSGGFFSRNPVAGKGVRFVTLIDNAVAARFLLDLAYYSKAKGNRSLLETAESALRAVGGSEQVEWEGRIVAEYVLALRKFVDGPMEFSVVGNSSDAKARALFAEARRVYEPRKILKYENPGRYPDLGKPAMYACTQVVCSQPVLASSAVVPAVAKLRRLIYEMEGKR